MSRGEVLWSRPSAMAPASLFVERDRPLPELVLSVTEMLSRTRCDVHLSRREARALADALTDWLAR